MGSSIAKDLNDIGLELGGMVEDVLKRGCKGGSQERWGYDAQLVNDLGKAVRAWRKRHAARERAR